MRMRKTILRLTLLTLTELIFVYILYPPCNFSYLLPCLLFLS